MAAFPLVGLTLGMLLGVVHAVVGFVFPPMVEGALLVAILAYVTGGFHLDGLSDTFDGVGGGWTRERSLEIMKDSRIGAFGAIALSVTILLKASAIGYLPDEFKFFALLAMPAAARGGVVFLAYKSIYARDVAGLGTPYTEHLDNHTVATTLGLSALISLLVGFKGLLAFAVVWAWAAFLKGYFHRKLGGITGDILGFAEETGEVLFLLTLYLLA